MLADFPAIRIIAERLQTGHLSAEGAGLSLAISLTAAAIAWAILRPRGR